MKNSDLWGDELWNAFYSHIHSEGWLTSNWAEILENEFSDWDEDYKDTNEKKTLFGLMYNKDFEESEDGKFIRPKSNSENVS